MQRRTNGEDDRIGFRLSGDPLRRIEEIAQAAGVSRHQVARELVVLALTGASREEVLAAISGVSLSLEEVHERLTELTTQQIRLTYNLAAAVEWLSLTIADPEARAIDPERLHDVVTTLFFEDESVTTPNLSLTQEVR